MVSKRKTYKRGSPFQRAVFLEILFEEASSLHVDTHSGKHNGKVVLVTILNALGLLHQAGLPTNLSSNLIFSGERCEWGANLVVGQTSSRENGNLLPTSNGVHCVDGRDTSLDHFLGIDTRAGVDGLTLKELSDSTRQKQKKKKAWFITHP